MVHRPVWVLLVALGTPSCADRDEARELREQLEDDDYRNTYARAPGWEEPRQPTGGGPHGDFVDIYVNDVIEQALVSGEALDAWPQGSIIVKDGWSAAQGGDYEYFAFMERREGGWFWAEFRGNGRLLVSGFDNERCADCHAAGQDEVRAFGLPQ